MPADWNYIYLCGTGHIYQFTGPIFFAQERVGKNGKKFKMYKFRSMYMDAEARKAELMKENKLGDGKMFKMDLIQGYWQQDTAGWHKEDRNW